MPKDNDLMKKVNVSSQVSTVTNDRIEDIKKIKEWSTAKVVNMLIMLGLDAYESNKS